MKTNLRTVFFVFLLLGSILYMVSQYRQLKFVSNKLELERKKFEHDLYINQQKLEEAEKRTFALGENLWTKKHTYDLKFVINNTYEFYAHKHILVSNSEYFEILFSKNMNLNVINYTDISKKDFNSILELLYFGKFRNNVSLNELTTIFKYLDTFMIIHKYTNYTDTVIASLFENSTNEDINNINSIANAYTVCKNYKLHQSTMAILKNVYSNWRLQGLFNQKHVATYNTLFYDYIKYLKCDKQAYFN